MKNSPLPLLLPLIFAMSVLLQTAGCGRPAQEEAAASPPEVTVYRVVARDTPVSFEFVGKTESSRRVEVRSRVEGFLEKRLYKEGAFVEEGQPLFRMDEKPFKVALQAAEAELAQQEARLVTAESNLKRVRPLARQNAVAQKELDDALGSYRSAAAAVEAARAKVTQARLNLGYTLIKSPVSGASSFAIKQEGAYIGVGTDSLLTYVAQLEPMWVEFSVSENQVLKLRSLLRQGLLREPPGKNYEVEVVMADGGIYPHRGQITFADVALSEETGTFLIRAEVANPDNSLHPGQFVRALIKGAVRPNAILVPQRAVQQGAQGSFVWVVDARGKAEFRPVEVGPWYEKQWFIDDGLENGETVVVDGALRLRAGIPVQITSPERDAETDANTAGRT